MTGGPVAVVVVNYGSHELLERNLAWAVPGGAGQPCPVVVVDNPRTPQDTEAIAALASSRGWDLVRRESNSGFGDGVNAGADRAWALGCSAVVVVNPDVEIDQAQVTALGEAALSEPETITAPLVLGPTGKPWGRLGEVDVRGGRLKSEWTSGPAWISGACFAVHQDLWTRLGGFDSDYVMYWEDVDLSLRCQELGGTLLVRDDIVVTHDVGGTQGSERSSLYYYYNCRNRLLFAAKRLPASDARRWVRTTGGDVRRVIRRGGLGRVARMRRAFPPSLRGVVAGLWWMARHRWGGRV